MPPLEALLQERAEASCLHFHSYLLGAAIMGEMFAI
jgi:hypothetical protein